MSLVNHVHVDDRVLFCQRCQKNVSPVLNRSGPHIKAVCPECVQFIKFVRQLR